MEYYDRAVDILPTEGRADGREEFMSGCTSTGRKERAQSTQLVYHPRHAQSCARIEQTHTKWTPGREAACWGCG